MAHWWVELFPPFILEYPYGSEGRLYRTGDLSTDNLTAVGSTSAGGVGDWTGEDSESWSREDQDQTRTSVVKFQDEEEIDDGREVRRTTGKN